MVAFVYGISSYVAFVLTAFYAFAFTENWFAVHTLDGTPAAAPNALVALLSNCVLFGLFAVQHAFMGRPVFVRAWTRVLPSALARSTHVLVSSLFLTLVLLRWKPIPLELWSLGLHPLGFVLEVLSYAGWAIALTGTFQIDHLGLFGLGHVLADMRGEYVEPALFQVPYLYRWVRHPIYAGLLLALWSAPRMTLGHLLLAALATGYVVVLARMEERDLARAHREYRGYQARVPMLVPRSRPLALRKRA